MSKKQEAKNERLRKIRMDVANELKFDKDRNNKEFGLCEGQDFQKHMCKGRIELNEVIYPRNVFQKLPFDEQMYFWHKINSALCCSFFHNTYGHRRKYRDWHLARVVRVYTYEEVSEWCYNAPLAQENLVPVDKGILDDTNDYLF